MKFKKSFSLILAALMLSSAFVSCTKDEGSTTGDETTGNVETQEGETTGETTEGDTTGETEAPAASGPSLDSVTAATTPDAAGTVNPVTIRGEGYDPAADDFGTKYEEVSGAVYDGVYGEFAEIYAEARAEIEDIGFRYAKMAIAEAKLLETATMLPLSADGGNYAISRTVPKTVTSTLWGNDSDRYHNMIVCTEMLTSEDNAALRELWNEKKGTGTWEESARAYLADHGYTTKDTYTMGYSTDPVIWDVLATSRQADTAGAINTYDGLMEYNNENQLVPALAEALPTVSEDGLTYTFKIKQGVKWVDSQGREVAEVKADDWVAGMQHMCDAMGGLEYLVDGLIVNAGEYMRGECDFSEVGVKAVDDYTLEYTLTDKAPYFETMFSYSVFAPLCRTYYESKGGKFGLENYDASAEDYTYGKTTDDLAYCGPYLVTNNTAKNTIVFEANPTYWNKDNINLQKITWLYNDGSDATKAYNDAVAGTIDGCGLNAAALAAAKTDGNFDKYHYTSSCTATSFMAFINLNRTAYANVADTTTVVSTLSETEKPRTLTALGNVHFRRAICQSLDRAAYNAQSVGEDLKLVSLRNTYTPGDFVMLPNDATVSINGTDKTYPAGTFYGEIMQDQITADGFSIKVWDPTNATADAFDGWYDPEAAVAELKTAVDQLKAEGLEVTTDNPIHVELPYFSASEGYTNKANSLKQSIENVLGGYVVIDLVACQDSDQWQNAGYYTTAGYEANYDIYDLSGWGPDYGDPQTYLDTFLGEYAGYMAKCVGIY